MSFEEETRDTLNCIVVMVSIVPLTKIELGGRRVYFRIKKKSSLYIASLRCSEFESEDF